MPLTLNVGVSKKHGRDFGSIGAHCSVSVELDVSLLNGDLQPFHRHVRNAYAACSQAVNEELSRQTADGAAAAPAASRSVATHTAGGNGSGAGAQAATAPGAGNSHATGAGGNGSYGANQKQIGYVNLLARQIRGLGVRKLDSLTARMFGKPLASLTSLEASSLIDTLKAIKEGTVSLDATLNGVDQ